MLEYNDDGIALCPECGEELYDAGCYKLDCGNEQCDFFQTALEEGQIEDLASEDY